MLLDLTPLHVARFWSYVEKTETCWFWRGALNSDGYGNVHLNGRQYRCHRVAWEMANGLIPPDLIVLHSCDVNYAPGDRTYRACVRPDHLYLGSNADNMRDMAEKGRSCRGDRNGARLYPERLKRGDESPARLHPERRARGDAHGSHTHPERWARGESQTNAKLTDTRVRAIRLLYAAGGITLTELGQQFGVSYSTIGQVVRRKTWTHIG